MWERLEALRPQSVVILKPDHVRDVDLFVRWYGARAYGPNLFWRDDVPHTELEAIRPGDELPGGLQVHHDGRGQMETPVYLPEQRALVFADAMTAPGGVLRVWGTPWHEERTLPALRALLSCRSSTSSSPTASRCTRARTTSPRSSASRGRSERSLKVSAGANSITRREWRRGRRPNAVFRQEVAAFGGAGGTPNVGLPPSDGVGPTFGARARGPPRSARYSPR